MRGRANARLLRLRGDRCRARPGRHRLGRGPALDLQHPLRERFTALLMLALYRAGRQSEALRAFASAQGVTLYMLLLAGFVGYQYLLFNALSQ